MNPLQTFEADQMDSMGVPQKRDHWTMRPVILDTTELFDEILERTRASGEFRLIDAAHAGRVRILAAAHVGVEVPAKINQRFERRGATPQEGLRIWEDDYLPYIHFVDTSGLPTQSSELERLEVRDPSDLAQARLTTLLSPVLSLSSDKDLIDNGFAAKSRWRTTQSVRMQMEGEARYLAVVLPGGLAWAGFGSAFRMAGTAWGRPGKLMVAGVGLGGIWLLSRGIKKTQPATRIRLLSAADAFMQMLADATDKQQRADKQLTQLRVNPAGLDEVVVMGIGGLLASAIEPMTATQISRELWTEDGSVPQTFFLHVRDQLSQLPAFVQIGSYGWQLGRVLERF